MVEFVTPTEAAAHLRLDTTPGGPDALWLSIFIPAISESVLAWLKEEWRAYVPEEDSNGDPILDSNGDTIPADPLTPKWAVKAAVLIELASAFRFREGEGTDNVMTADAGYGYVLNKVSTNLLTPLRRPTLT